MLKEELKFETSTVLEGMTSISALIKGWESGTNDRKIEKVLYDKAREDKIARQLSFLRHRAIEYGFEIKESAAEDIDALTLGNSHGGIIAICSDRTILPLNASAVPQNGFFVMIQGIEDPYNFGYALRSLYACGCDGVILPERNWMGAAGVVARSSAGASEMMKMFTAKAEDAAVLFKSCGYRVVAADERGETYLKDGNLKRPILLIIGGERRGISRSLLEKCDELVKINYGRTFEASLSAASAATILGYEIMIKNL